MAIWVVDADHNVLHRATERTFGRDLDQLLDELESELHEARRACPDATSLGIGIPSTLDHERGGEIASRLQGIYAFCRRHLIEAAAEQDPKKIEEVSELLGELRGAWAEIAGSEA